MVFVKWYLHQLQASPIRTNLASAFILMTTGDVMAQVLEHHHIGGALVDGRDEVVHSHPVEQNSPRVRRLSLRRYGTHSSIDTYRRHEVDNSKIAPVQAKAKANEETIERKTTSTTTTTTAAHWNLYPHIKNEIMSLDPYRIITMVTWNVVVTTPFFILLYRVCDRVFVPPTFWTVGTRVFVTLMCSIPLNALFFTYGTCIHHCAEWYSLRRDLKGAIMEDTKCEDMVAVNVVRAVAPFDYSLMWSKVQLKIESELLDTVKKSAAMWVPINAVNFSCIPPHLRPLWMMSFSVFWNCYLSIVQHRDLVVPMKT